ncbi:MAG: hypothetical protein NVSMB56_04530 [Pyrinomonadaceae bacterium]
MIWKYRADVDEQTRAEHAAMLRRLPSLIAEIESLGVGFDVIGLPRSYDLGLVVTFRNRAALETYTVHPEHVKVAEFGQRIHEHIASVDFED